jgi:predicted esterase
MAAVSGETSMRMAGAPAPTAATNSSGGSGGSTPGMLAAAGSGGGGSSSPAPNSACNENILPLPDDPSVRGPWDVGVRTVKLGRLTVEVVYPAQPGSTAGLPEATYNLKDWLPDDQRSKVPDDHSPQVGPLGGHLYRDVPIDEGHGPYPVVIFIHGTASMRIANGSTNAMWASRGMVVMMADYPGLTFADQLKFGCGQDHDEQDVDGDLKTQLDALDGASGELAFLAGHIDMKRLGLSGHSQGACMSAVNSNLANVQIIVPLTGSSQASESPSLKSIMWIAGMDDMVIGYDSALLGNAVCPANPAPATSNVDAYTASPGQPNVKKRMVGIKGAGHLNVTDLCQTNMQGKNAVQEAVDDGVCGVDGAAIIGLPALNDCGSITWKRGVEITTYVSTLALEETLHCLDRTQQFANLQAAIPELGDYRHEP